MNIEELYEKFSTGKTPDGNDFKNLIDESNNDKLLHNSPNLFNHDDKDIIFGSGFSGATNTIVGAPIYNITGYMPVSKGDTIFIGKNGVKVSESNDTQFYKVVLYTDKDTWKETKGYTKDGYKVITDGFIRVQAPVTNDKLQVEVGGISPYAPYTANKVLTSNLIPPTVDNYPISNIPSEERFTAYGDSLTAKGIWQDFVAGGLGIKGTSFAGVSSSTVALFPSVEATIPSMVNDTRLNGVIATGNKLNIVQGGTNDAHRGIPIGDISELDKKLEDKNKETFIGAFSYIVERLLIGIPYAEIILATPPRADKTKWNYNYAPYVEAVHAVAKYYGLEVADWYNNTGINHVNISQYTTDGLHRNEQGDKRQASEILRRTNKYR